MNNNKMCIAIFVSQEAFFGKEILDKSKTTPKEAVKIDSSSEKEDSRPTSPKVLPDFSKEDGSKLLNTGLLPVDSMKVPSSCHVLPSVGQPLPGPSHSGPDQEDLGKSQLYISLKMY